MWRFLLRPLEPVYRLGLDGRRVLYRLGVFKVRRLPVPVLSVGNLTMGGTGKTPLTIFLAQEAVRRGFRPCVLTRGYGGSVSRGVHPVSDRHRILLGARAAGDEAVLMAEKLPGIPVVKAPVRFDGGMYGVEHFGADLMVLDDGFQHWELARDVNVLLVDGEKPAAEGRCIPAGTLREPVSAAGRADVVVAVGNGHEGRIRSILGLRSEVPVWSAELRVEGYRQGPGGRVFPREDLRGKRVFIFCGIARPERFLRSVEALGAHVVGFKAFRDHHFFSAEEEHALARTGRDTGADLVLTTEKDGVRLGSGGFATLVTAMGCEQGLADSVFDRVPS